MSAGCPNLGPVGGLIHTRGWQGCWQSRLRWRQGHNPIRISGSHRSRCPAVSPSNAAWHHTSDDKNPCLGPDNHHAPGCLSKKESKSPVRECLAGMDRKTCFTMCCPWSHATAWELGPSGRPCKSSWAPGGAAGPRPPTLWEHKIWAGASCYPTFIWSKKNQKNSMLHLL